MIMTITEETVKYMAKSAAIELTNEEVAQMREYMSEMLDYMSILSKVDTEGVEPTVYVHNMVNIFSIDVSTGGTLSFQKLETMTPHFQNGYFKVPKIINN